MEPSSALPWLALSPPTKAFLSFGLVVLAVFEYVTAMGVFGREGPKPGARVSMRLHRICGYVFLVYFVWIAWACFELMGRLGAAGGYHLDARGAGHAALAFLLLGILALKISVIRAYRRYRPYVPLLGMVLAVGTFVLWGVAGWMYVWLLGGIQVLTGGG